MFVTEEVVSHPDTATEVIKWALAAIVAMAAFVALIVRWMMVRIDTNQSSQDKAIDAFTKALGSWQEFQREETMTHGKLMETQAQILRTQERILEKLDDMRKETESWKKETFRRD